MVTELETPVPTLPELSTEDADAVRLRDEAAALNRQGDTSDIQRQIDELDIAEAAPPEEEALAAAVIAPVPRPSIPKPVPSDETAQLRRQLAEYQVRERQYQARELQEKLQQGTEAVTRAFIASGWEETQARQFAEQQRDAYVREERLEAQHASQVAWLQERFKDAIELGTAHGIDPRELSNYQDRASMEHAAGQAKKIRDLEAAVAQLQQGRVPPQRLESGVPSPSAGASDDRIYERALLKPFDEMTPRERAVFETRIGVR